MPHHNHYNSSAHNNHRSNQLNPPSLANKEAALLSLMDRTGYNVVQENGQRKFGPPPEWIGPSPSKGCEVFIGKIPRDCYEDELVPVFERCGKIYELRLMMDFSGSNRGYAFIMYTNYSDAQRAIQELNNYEIRPRKFIGVVKSLDNCRLFVGGIPKNKTKDDIIEEMRKITDGVINAIVYSSVNDKSRNRGFAFVEYGNHRSAAMARRKLLPGKIQLWGHDIAVDWADPEPEVDENIMSKVTVLYARNLNLNTREDQILEIFSLGPMNLKIEKVKKMRDFAFIHYANREDAERALQVISRMNFSHITNDGHPLEVTWAKPPNSSRANKRRNNQNRSSSDRPYYANGSNGLLQSSQSSALSPAFGYVFNPMSPPFASYDYHNAIGFMSPHNSPYTNSSFGHNSMQNYQDLGQGNGYGYLSPATQFLFRGASLASH